MLPRLPALLLIAAPLLGSTGVWAETHIVSQGGSVQDAVDVASDGDVIVIEPGTYAENVVIRGKDLTLQSNFATSGDPLDVENTVLEAVLEGEEEEEDDDDEMVLGNVIEVRAMSSVPGSDPTEVVLIGLTIRNGESGVNIRPNARVEILDSTVVGNDDGIELEGRATTAHAIARGIVRRCLIEHNRDDGVDVDQRSELWIEDSIIRDNVQDGIEIRLQDNLFEPGESIENVILRNQLLDNGQDGLQLIDYYALTPRSFRVERNIIAGNGSSGLGMMCEERTIETFEACPIEERVELVHNTFSSNDHGLTGGANLLGVSNLFVGHANIGVKNVVDDSLLTASLFHGNGTPHTGSDANLVTTLLADPLLEPDFTLGAGSPAIDAGLATFEVGGETILELTPCDYFGQAPDLGAFERDTGPPLLWTSGMLLADASQAALQKGAKAKASEKRLDLGSSKGDMIAGVRFEDIGIPPGAEIVAAQLELMSAKKARKAAALVISGEASDDAAPFSTAPNDLSARPDTTAQASWNVPLWPGAGMHQATPDLAAVVQEIVDGPGWAEGNDMAFFVTGTGKRSVAAFTKGAPPLLHVDFRTSSPACIP
jgi:Right handed beta helix region